MNSTVTRLFCIAVATWFLYGAIGLLHPDPVLAARDRDSPAVRRFLDARELLWKARDARVDAATRAELAELDLSRTGLVGVEWSWLTSTPGNLKAKRLSADARWIGIYTDWFRAAGLEAGDRVAISASGSFPGLFLAARLAAEEYGLEPVLAASLAASNYGANVPAFDLYAMERLLLAEGLVRTPVTLWTPGGGNDRGGGLEGDGRELLLRRLEEMAGQLPPSARVVVPGSLAEAINLREAHFFGEAGAVENDRGIRLVINIGGNAANYGTGNGALSIPPGFIPPDGAPELRGDSLLHRAIRARIPALHVLAVEKLMESHAPLLTRGMGRSSTPSQTPLSSRVLAGLGFLGAFAAVGLACRRRLLPHPHEIGDPS